jgi:nitroimidazol reductase NimA-like FMN-containing flavoprotein (pyridoxamine 5'-phosphate oxidase superfamily)
MAIELSGPWQQQEISEFLDDSALPVRLSCIGGDGFPRVISLWYQYKADTLYCVTHQSSKLIKMLNKNNRVGFEVSPNTPPYCGVRGQGTAAMTALGESSLLQELVDCYVGDADSSFSRWLLSRSAEEIIISVTPHRLYSWDYRKRMSGAT